MKSSDVVPDYVYVLLAFSFLFCAITVFGETSSSLSKSDATREYETYKLQRNSEMVTQVKTSLVTLRIDPQLKCKIVYGSGKSNCSICYTYDVDKRACALVDEEVTEETAFRKARSDLAQKKRSEYNENNLVREFEYEADFVTTTTEPKEEI